MFYLYVFCIEVVKFLVMSIWKALGSIAGPLVGASGSVVGNLIGSSSQKSANKTNLQINQLNNDFNERMQRQNQAWQESMYNKYNSPVAQVKQLSDAGLNPALTFGNGAAMTGSVGNASASPAAAQQAFSPDMSGFVNSALSASDILLQKSRVESQNKNLDAQTQGLQIANSMKREELQAQIAKNLADAGVSKATIKSIMLGNEFNQRTMDARVGAVDLQNNVMRSQAALNDVNASLVRFNLDHAPEMFKAQLSETLARADAALASGQMSRAAAKNYISQSVLNYATANKVSIEAKTADRMSDFLVDKAHNDSKSSNVDWLIKSEQYNTYRDFGTFDIGSKAQQNLSLGGRFGIGVNSEIPVDMRSIKDKHRRNKRH